MMEQQAGQDAPAAAKPEPKLSAEAVTWAFRLLISRDPFTQEEIENQRTLPDLATLRRVFAETWEFHDFFDSIPDGVPTYGMPIFLMRPPADPAFPFRFAPPSLEDPVGQMCTAAQFDDPAFTEIMQAMGMSPMRSRRSWEQAWIVSVLATHGMVAQGRRGLGLGVGRERIPSLLASRGVQVLASDLAAEALALPEGAERMGLFYPEILHLEDFEQLVDYRTLDMRQLPADLDGQFDFCWSASALDRLGPVEAAAAFLEESLRVLKPGGISAHTFNLNISSDTALLRHPSLCALRRQDLETLAARIRSQGHEMLPVNLHPGLDAEDAEVSARPDGPPRPKQRHGSSVLTSFGLVLRKAGAQG
ncbi:class I SAM-dependent methyltransferase [Falsiroseomonas tokyonensis]|uniref:Class I SAM-dependent methyltransferase n=1 Tax=Falsiroseomonas tokyonensis TaxID=430521 RepID=A0ABV7BSX9_9PROT|nr:class I SAM-dependent methyltransferase [Falsiroseomonas tokyonensis]MBU8538638.1 class I SAM-dependent methyltransferase [Falsiroseomonas tokyonensis]